ncbi:MAG: pseudouridine synthase [Mangrovibacterium sp.]
MLNNPARVHNFQHDISSIKVPTRFPYLYSNKPHPLCLMAAQELQDFLAQQDEWNELLGTSGNENTIGKMFGVLVVELPSGNLGYLAGFSGAIGECNNHPHFVPPVYNLLDKKGFFKHGERELSKLNEEIKLLEESTNFQHEKQALKATKEEFEKYHQEGKAKLKADKIERQKLRQIATETLSGEFLQNRLSELNNESARSKSSLKQLLVNIKEKIITSQQIVEKTQVIINKLKEKRKIQSANLQEEIFRNFQLVNSKQEQKDVLQIFHEQALDTPPAGTGDCAAPKLLQHAFQQKLRPLALAEFWWGASPKSEIRKHKLFYPPCQNKCAPLLKHMLYGVPLEDNPIVTQAASPRKLDICYEDEWMVVINKPENFLSVPGKSQLNSVLQQLKEAYTPAPLLVHRLDMGTSGVLLAAKDENTYKALQAQFINRTTHKCYIAVLDGVITANSGIINLPLRVDIHNRPQQLVCHQHGKSARTHWEVIERQANQTRVRFHPITGRTHQLRVHATHIQGLNCPIVGDSLYGKAAQRLHLHAESLEITHPNTGERITFHVPTPF